MLVITILLWSCLATVSHSCVFITVSSLWNPLLEMNWLCKGSIDEVALYGSDPEGGDAKELVKIQISQQQRNYYTTNVEFYPDLGKWSRNSSEERNLESQCLYWISGTLNGSLIHKNCFGIRPAWMWEHRSNIENLSIPMLFIPGTHNSACYASDVYVQPKSEDISTGKMMTQDQNVWTQLVFGIRSLDLRIGYYPETADDISQRFWINHDKIRNQRLLPVLRQVAEFVKASQGEVIILDFHRFPSGFELPEKGDVHKLLLEVIERELGNLTIPRPDNPATLTLKNIWETDRRIIVSYNEEEIFPSSPSLWRGIHQRWGDKQKPGDLRKFLSNIFSLRQPKDKLWAAMAELTLTFYDALFTNKTIRDQANEINRLLSLWFDENQDWTENANIVATDYFLGNEVIDLAIRTNLRKATTQPSFEDK